MLRATRTHRHELGQTLVEVVVAIAITAILLPALATALVASREGRAQEEERLQATALLREADEAVRSVREKGWTQFATNGTYRPSISGSTWSLVAGAETIGSFTRQIVVSDVQRNASGAIVASGGTVDPSTKKVVSTVSWTLPLPSSISTETYLQRYLGNTAWTQTTQADFTAGTETNTVATATSGGQVELASGGAGGSVSWTSPSIAGSYDQSASTTDTFDVFVDDATDRAYLTIGTTLRIINVANPAAPSLLGTYTAGGNINGVYVSGNYAYLATANNSGEFVVVNITNPASPTATVLDLTGNNDGTMVFVSGTRAYVTRLVSTTSGQNEFYIINITTPTSPAVLGSLNLTANANSVYVVGNFAYLATSIGTAELTIVNVSNAASPTQAGVFNTTGTAAGSDVFAVGTTVYLTKANDTSGPEFFILNASNPSIVSSVGTHEVGANVNGVYITGTTAFLGTALANNQFRVLNIATPASPTVISNFNTAAVVNDLVQIGNYAYLATASDTQEMIIMQGTVSGGGYQTTGTFESSTLDASTSVGFNYLTFTISEPASTNIQFQIATNTDNATWSFVGPDNTASTFYTAPGAIPLGKASGRYLRYRASFTGPGTSTPVLSDVSVNYSP